MGTKAEEQAAAYRAEQREWEAPTGLRTERVTLEITLDDRRKHHFPAWNDILRDAGAIWPTESVRVVEESVREYFPTFTVQDVSTIQNIANDRVKTWQDANMKALAERNEAREERDRAIREREDLLTAHCRYKEAALNRVAVLESQLESAADRAATAETALESAPAASEWRILDVDVGETVEAGDEMTDALIMPWCDAGPCVGKEVARGPIYFRRRVPAPAASVNVEKKPMKMPSREWSERMTDDSEMSVCGLASRVAELESAPAASDVRSDHEMREGIASIVHEAITDIADWMQRAPAASDWAESHDADTASCVPLYAAPQPAPGWPTEEERKAVDHARAALKTLAWQFRNGFDHHAAEVCEQSEEILFALLARSTPPEVVLPEDDQAVDAPQPAPGWLTEEERKFLHHHRQECEERASTFSNAGAAKWVRRVKLIDALLARSTPPQVVLPEVCPFTPDSTHAMGWWEALGRVKKALVAAGVPWKEVGRE